MSEKMTIEETIKGLQSMIYSTRFISHDFNGVVDEDVCERAIELLKDQEFKLVDNIQIRQLDTVGDCPSCGIGISKHYHPMYCGLCGQAVKWYD